MAHGITSIFLLGLSVQDLRTRRLSLWGLCGFLAVGAVFAAIRNGPDPMAWMKDLSIGALLLLLRKFCDEGIGSGDGLTLSASGLVLGFRENLILFAGGIVLCAFAAGIFWMVRRNGKMTLPMVPFFLLAEVLQWSLR